MSVSVAVVVWSFFCEDTVTFSSYCLSPYALGLPPLVMGQGESTEKDNVYSFN